MLTALLFAVAYYCFCLVWFSAVQRTAFCLYNRSSSPDDGRFPSGMLARIYRYGLRSDLVGAVYFTAIPVIIAATATATASDASTCLNIYNIIAAVIIGLAAASDMLIYRFWQSKIDASALHYLKSAEGAAASVSPLFIAGSLVIWALFAATFYAGAAAITHLTIGLHHPAAHGAWQVAATVTGAIVLLGLLFLILRGTGRPKTPSVSFFSPEMFYNHCAVNAEYNFIYSIAAARDKLDKRYHVYPDDECAARAGELYPTSGKPLRQLLHTSRPNILFVIWESLSARFFEDLGGQSNILVNLQELAREGVLMTRCDAGNIRTDRGLPCLLSGYPCPPGGSVIRYTRKLPNLPSLPRTLSGEGYATSMWHGADLSFYHMKDYLMALGFDRIIQKEDLDPTLPQSKWGVHDGPMFDLIYDDIQRLDAEGRPWMTTVLSLSSHEDFRVPYNLRPDDPIANAFAYTDRELGRLVGRLKSTPGWDDMLIVVTGDHGFYFGAGIERDQYPHIPMVLLGGAVKEPAVIDTIMSQSDVAATLLGQLGIDHSHFPFSRDVLADTYTDQFSFHTHQTGFMVRDRHGFTEFDLASRTAVSGDDPNRVERGRITLQQFHTDLSRR